MKRKNCWEIKKCGREQGGENAKRLGVCSVALPNKYDSVNNGKYGGRFCWIVNGTAGKSTEDKHAKKLWECIDCEVLRQVQGEEEQNFIPFPQFIV